jgi:O-antigen/teichoic acid export membrane protein
LSRKPLSHHVGILSLGRFFAFAVAFFVPLVNVRALSVEEYGYYSQFWLLFSTLTPLLILGFPRSLLYYFPRSESRQEKSAYVAQTVAYLFGASLVAAVIYTAMGEVLGSGLGEMIRTFYWQLCLFTIFMLLSRHMEELFVADGLTERQSVYYMATAATRSIVVIATAWYTRDVGAILWALMAFAAAKAAFALIYTRAVYRPSPRQVSFSTIREQISFALPLGMMAIVTLLLTQTDKFIINRFMGREAFAVYSVGSHQLPFATIISSSVATITFPLMARYQKDGRFAEFIDLWRRSWLKTSVLFFPICAFLMVTAPQLIVILFTEKYADATPVFQIYLLLFLKSTTDYAGVLTAFKKQDYLFKITAVAVAANIGLSIFLYQVWGRLGVPFSTVVTFFILALLAVRKGSGLLGQPFWRTVPWRGLLARMAAAAAPCAPLYFLYARSATDNIVRYAIAGVAYFAVYFLICWVFRLLTLDDIRSLLGKRARSSGSPGANSAKG